MAVNVIEQQPLLTTLPVGQEIIFVTSNLTAVANESQVKYIMEVHISDNVPPNTASANDLIGTFKTTPNNAGSGIFDLRNVIENYVSAENMAADGSTYKGATTTSTTQHPLHLIDKYSNAKNIVRYMVLQFKVEYLGGGSSATTVGTLSGSAANSALYEIFNGYVKHTDELLTGGGVNGADFGLSLDSFEPEASFPAASTKKFLTNAPTIQYANDDDYGTFSFLATDNSMATAMNQIKLTYYNSSGSTIGNETIDKTTANGAYTSWSAQVKKQLVHFGVFPANLRNWSSTFKTLHTAGTIQGGYYMIQGQNASNHSSTAPYYIYLNCPDERQYESIRLCWLNQWGVWDYYTFTKKSTRTISAKPTTYRQLGGTWNNLTYRPDGYKGGKRNFRVNATEKIKINTDFVTENENVMFEEMINSPEVYMLKGYQDDSTFAMLSNYVTPVLVTSKSFTKKTVANDKLIQYTFEIENSRTLRTQSV